jgi:hypothetical protein
MSPERGAATAFDPPRPILPPIGTDAGRPRQTDGTDGFRMVPRAQGCAWSVLLGTDAEEADAARGLQKESNLKRALHFRPWHPACSGFSEAARSLQCARARARRSPARLGPGGVRDHCGDG